MNILYAVDTFATMRFNLLDRTKNKEPGIYYGLHSIEKTMSGTYLDRNRINWLLEHFELYKQIIDRKIGGQDKDYKRECIEYFSNVFRTFLELNGKSFVDSKMAIGILKELECKLDEMINFSDDWENGYNHLCVLMAKNKEKYRKLKREMMEV